MNRREAPHESIFGLTARFALGDYRRANALLDHATPLGVARLRVAVDAAEFNTAAGRAWHEWLAAAVAARAEFLPSLVCADARDQGDPTPTIGDALATIGGYCSAVELWTVPRAPERDPRLDPNGARFAERLADQVQAVRDARKQVVLAGPVTHHAGWLELFGARGLLREFTAIGLHGAMGAADLGSGHWLRRIERTRELLQRHGAAAELWISETEFHHDGTQERAQIRAFVETLDSPAQRFYWGSAQQPAAETPPLYGADGNPSLLARILAEGGAVRLRELLALSPAGAPRHSQGVALITGGAGFIGTNLAARLIADGRTVRIVDNLSRPGTERNLRWLVERFEEKVEFRLADVRDRRVLRAAVADATEVYHLAAQVAVTTSLADPSHDFEVNGRGTLNLLEELRRLDKPPPLLFTSTNKVYGGLDDLPLSVSDSRYEMADPALRARGIDESRPLSFCSPYGCSKGAADQYVLDFAHTFHLPAAVFRMSCIYGPHQFGTEDQGWVAHFLRRAIAGQPIVIFGDGRQVRDILFVEDLVEAFLLARDRIEALRGQAFNIGGGAHNTVSLRELLTALQRLHGTLPEIRYEGWRASDQRYYVSDLDRFTAATGWRPRTGVQAGLEQLHAWLMAQHALPHAPAPAVERMAL